AAMIPLILNEPSHLKQEKMCKELASETGVTLKTIQNELNRLENQKEREKTRDKLNIIEKLTRKLNSAPDEARTLLQEAENSLFELDKIYDEDSMSEASFLSIIQSEKEEQEKRDGSASG